MELESAKLTNREGHRPRSLSRGEMQRLAMIRALVNDPQLLLADEPTANLDRDNARIIWDRFRELNRSRGLTVVVATHNLDLVRDADHVIHLRHGTGQSQPSSDR